MEDLELKNIWQSYDRRLEESRILNLQSWALNVKCFEALQRQKANSKLNALAAFNKGAVILGIVWVLFLGVLVYGNQLENLYFTFSVSIIMLFNIFAVAVYIKHNVIIKRINYSESIIDTQKKLSRLQASTINSTRILFLQTPFYSTWFWHSSWIDYSSWQFWGITFPITLLLTLAAIWLFKNISLKNMDKKWLKALMMAGPEYKYVLKAKEFIEEIEEFKREI